MTRKKSKTLTLKDVAERLQVSTATVSNAFNRPSQLSAELRQHILDECAKFDYYGPSASARVMRTGKTSIVGIMLSNYLAYSFSDPIANQFLQGVAEVFERKNYNMLISPSRENLAQIKGAESFVDGFIIYGPPNREKLEELRRQNKSIVTVDFNYHHYDSVNIDNIYAARRCALHAFAHRPKRVAVIALRVRETGRMHRLTDEDIEYDPTNITSQRLKGYLEAAEQEGIEIRPENIVNVPDNTREFGLAAASELLMSADRPDMILCMSDCLALATLELAASRGIQVPKQLMVTGFDGIAKAADSDPGLTTIQQHSIEKGRLAAEIFLGLKTQKQIVMPTSLIVRDSCPDASDSSNNLRA